jgi:GH15 family glucan-1,4-alpha-glucosidase
MMNLTNVLGMWSGRNVVCASMLVLAAAATAQPTYIFHGATTQVFGEASGITMREPDAPRQDEAVDLWIEIGYSFEYQNIAVYYTTDGTTPQGGFGNGDGTTQVLTNLNGGISFVRNQFDSGANRNRDWWRARLPASARQGGQTIKYKIGTWGGPNGGFNKFTNGANTSSVAQQFEFRNALAWPGAGAGQVNPAAGYPPVSFWKEEAIFGNTFCAGQIDRNGTVYDFHFPTPGGVGGVGTRNEGYVDGVDTFPPGLPSGWRGQMHVNQAMPGIRVDGVTHWLSNPNGVSYGSVQQEYLEDTNSIRTTQTLTAGGNNISVEQIDFAPMGVSWPADGNGAAQKHLYIKRMLLTNNGPTKTVNVYWYVDPAINGGDGYDAMFVDSAKSAMVAYDNTYRVVTGTGVGFPAPNEYNPSTFGGYEKNKSLYLASAMKVMAPGGGIERTATDFWRDTSADNGQGWMGAQVTLPTGVTREVDIIMAGAVDNTAGAAGTYSFKLANAIEWFYQNSTQSLQSSTDGYWSNWLNSNTTVSTPDASVNEVFKRGLLATALHVDGVNGGIIAGFHNGAYPYVWPRDAVYGAITLARTGHLEEAAGVYRWMKETCYRDFEPWGRKGFWKQKYSTDGYVIWGAPQIDETAVFPWGVKFQYDMTGDSSVLSTYVEQVRDAVQTMTRDSSDSRLRYEEAFNLVYSNNVWEDSYDTFIYSNANIIRGLHDAASIFQSLGLHAEALDAHTKANTVKGGLDGRLDWNGENTDISQLGIAYPFSVYAYNDARVNKVIDRINGVREDRLGNVHPLMNFTGQHAGTLNRYWSDGYWNGGPWFLSTLWYGLFYGERQDVTPGTADIDNLKLRLDLCIDRLGPAGLGAEQIAFSNSLLYPGQDDFVLQTAWPNAWESMSTLADTVMKFIDYTPEAWANRLVFEPKLPSAWNTMTFHNVTLRNVPANQTHKIDVTVERTARGERHTFTNNTGNPATIRTTLRLPGPGCFAGATRNGVPVISTLDNTTGRVIVDSLLDFGAGTVTVIETSNLPSADFNQDGGVDGGDIEAFFGAWEIGDFSADFNEDGGVDGADVEVFFAAWENGCV